MFLKNGGLGSQKGKLRPATYLPENTPGLDPSRTLGAISAIQPFLLDQWFSAGGNFVPQETFKNVWRQFGCHNLELWGMKRYWHLMGRGQGCCQISYNAPTHPPAKNYLAPKGNNAKADKLH